MNCTYRVTFNRYECCVKVDLIHEHRCNHSKTKDMTRPIVVAEPPKLSRLKCADHHHKGNISSNALQTEQFLVCRVTSRYNHWFSDRTSIPRTRASPEILQPQFYNTGIK